MAPGGRELIPLPARGRHPAALAGTTRADFAHAQTLALWPYFTFDDPRLTLGARYVQLRQDAGLSATKLGLSHQAGWVGYVGRGHFFVKRFGFEPGAIYPDGGCNFETYTDPDILELETLSPLASVDPGDELTHVERWEAHELGAAARDALDAGQPAGQIAGRPLPESAIETHLLPLAISDLSAFSR
jgi:hypothetical protein